MHNVFPCLLPDLRDALPRISQMICLNLACDLRQTLET